MESYKINHNMKRLLTTIPTLILYTTFSYAQEAKTLTLEQAINISLERNPTIISSRHSEQAAAYNRKAARGLKMPQINITGNYSYLSKDISLNTNNLKENFSSITTDIITSATQSGILSQQASTMLSNALGQISSLDWSYTLQNRSLGFIGAEVNIPIFLGGKINTVNHIARIEEMITRQQSAQAENSLISELIERYYALSLATHVLHVREQVASGIRHHLNDAIAMEEQGIIAHSERLYVEYKMAEAERELRDAGLELITIKEALCATLSTSDDIETATPMFTLSEIEDVDYYKHLAATSNPLLLQVELKRELSEQGVRLQRSEFYPQIIAMGVANIYNYQLTNLLPRWAVGVGVSFKLFDGLNREYKYMASKEVVRRVEQIATKAHDDIGVLVEKLYNQLLNYHNRIISIDSSIRFAQEYLQAKKRAFSEGWITASELIDAELNLAKALTERLEAAYKYDTTLAKLLETAGIITHFIDYIRRNTAQIIE